ncbi:MAG: hypothetical protein ACPGRZ_13205, partial [Alphaproteobacteria bacterium]
MKCLIWAIIAFLALVAAMAPLSHLAGGVSWQAMLPVAAKAAENGAEPILHPAIADPANITPERAEEIYKAIRVQV